MIGFGDYVSNDDDNSSFLGFKFSKTWARCIETWRASLENIERVMILARESSMMTVVVISNPVPGCS
jgi:hypothetical protein